MGTVTVEDHLSEASRLLRLAADYVDEVALIRNTAIQDAALIAARGEVNTLLNIVRKELGLGTS